MSRTSSLLNRASSIRKVDDAMAAAPTAGNLPAADGQMLIAYTWLWSVMFLLFAPVAALWTGEGWQIFSDFRLILISPSKLVTDYFMLGGAGAAFLNAGLCGLSCNLLMLLSRARPTATLMAGYFLVVAHCFYGLNLVNMWPPILGIFLFSLVMKDRFGNILHLAMFSTSLGPFISDLLFRYTLGDGFVFGEVHMTPLGVILALLFGLGAGFLIPALLPGTSAMHRGHNLFKAGLAIGLFGMFANALLYKTMGIDVPDTVFRTNPLYRASGEDFILMVDVFFSVIFLVTLLLGFLGNGKSFRGYRALWNCDGWQDDFPRRFGMPLTMINVAVYGFFILAYMNAVLLLTSGVGYSGPTVGVTIAAITFSASGQTARTVWPIAAGYAILSVFTGAICSLAGWEAVWSLSTQGYLNGFAFATGLCPFSGRYGRKWGVVAGILHGILCTSTAAMHGGFVLYNGGLTSGLTALLLIPILDFYHVKTVPSREEQAALPAEKQA